MPGRMRLQKFIRPARWSSTIQLQPLAVLAVTLTLDWLEMVSGEVIAAGGPGPAQGEIAWAPPGRQKFVLPALPPKLDQPGLARDLTPTWPSEQATRAVATRCRRRRRHRRARGPRRDSPGRCGSWRSQHRCAPSRGRWSRVIGMSVSLSCPIFHSTKVCGMTTMWNASYRDRWRAGRHRDPEQVRFLTMASLRWVIANRAYSPWYLVRYLRLARFRLTNPHVVLRGMVFLGRNVEIHATPELARMEIGRWVHRRRQPRSGPTRSLRIGDKAVFRCNNVVNSYLDLEIGSSTLVADWCYIRDFDHKMDNSLELPIKDQGIVKGPVRIGRTRGSRPRCRCCATPSSDADASSALAAVVKGVIPDYSIAVSAPHAS